MTNIFGKSITRKFYPVEDGEPINLVSQAPSIYLFSEQPTRTVAAAGTGALETINYWIESAQSPYVRTFTIPAIDDPEPTGTTPQADYWLAINYKAEATEQTQTDIKSITVERAKSTSDIPGTKVQDVVDVYPDIYSYASFDQITAKLDNALSELKLELKGKGLEWGNLSNLKDLKLALAYKVIQLVAESQLVEGGDKFDLRRQLYKEKYEEIMKLVVLAYDVDGDGDPDTTEQAQSIAVIAFR